MKTHYWGGLVLCLILASVLISCAGPAPLLEIKDAWGLPSTTMPTTGGIYMAIKNTGSAPDKLLSGKSPACGSIELHEVVMKSDGSMGMNLRDKPIEIPAGGQVELKSSGLHIMCIMRKDELFKPGAVIDLTLVFEKSGEKTVSAEIRSE